MLAAEATFRTSQRTTKATIHATSRMMSAPTTLGINSLILMRAAFSGWVTASSASRWKKATKVKSMIR